MYVVDLHVHSKYSRATSKDMEPQTLSRVAKWKGVHMLGTGDILHPAYRREVRELLKEKGDGVYTLNGVDFLLTVETSHVYSQGQKLRKIHIVWVFPDFETVDRAASILEMYGKLDVDGRPTFGLSVQDMTELMISINEEIMVIPAHVWTPWFSLFGSNSGFDSVQEAFGPLSNHVLALETGLSSDPPMNWRVSSLDAYTLVSNSDAHSPDRIGREANVFREPVTFYSLREILESKDQSRFLFTVEFYPEEGKYHYDGHRTCGIRFHPQDTQKTHGICPVCGRPLTIGVLHRVENLADRPEGYVPQGAIPYKNLIPLKEIIAQDLGVGVCTKKVLQEYQKGISRFGNELEILLNVPEVDLKRVFRPRTVEGILRARRGDVRVEPGYDGVYGRILVLNEEHTEEPQQGTLF